MGSVASLIPLSAVSLFGHFPDTVVYLLGGEKLAGEKADRSPEWERGQVPPATLSQEAPTNSVAKPVRSPDSISKLFSPIGGPDSIWARYKA